MSGDATERPSASIVTPSELELFRMILKLARMALALKIAIVQVQVTTAELVPDMAEKLEKIDQQFGVFDEALNELLRFADAFNPHGRTDSDT